MARRKSAEKRERNPDPKFQSTLVTQIVNGIMRDGKKSIAESVVYGAIDELQARASGEEDGLSILKRAINNVKPSLEVKSRRVGGATYQVPVEVNPNRRQALAIRWIADAARRRTEQNMARRLAGELSQAANNEGAAVKKRVDTHRMAEANKAFAHFRW
ncbi:MAG TPA: 30S ribosomal protein S7 [Fibrobacteria bacterium]|jgi:small subunit ribosomal protein S7|nr:30S ribosomal protein S7 [Fibrobacterota bacterium]MBK9577808.1 30S ribosomal protein S7 [Fibrobacterota bacterium]QQS06821.1 MAG: 30S ribosomal protein S7 [Fibrobacterota bacterium]HNY32305.1 30S ribosomal protein S7 [Fibrobacteria bacterium]HOX51814.1 30S ribosomal protein S7 [Fibrobacteria bacterium]